MDVEEWREVAGSDGYEVSSHGRLRKGSRLIVMTLHTVTGLARAKYSISVPGRNGGMYHDKRSTAGQRGWMEHL